MGIDLIPGEIIMSFLQFAVLSASGRDMLNSVMTIKLAQVNRLFRSIVFDMPILWGTVSNKQSPEMLHLCLERSRESLLRVVLLLDDRGTDSYIDFLQAVAAHTSRWEEFYFETGRFLSDYLPIIYALPNHTHDLQLPQLRTLTLLYPDPYCYDSDLSDLDDIHGYIDNADQSKNNFYDSWVTPKLQQLRTRNIVPRYTRGAELTTCEVKFESCGYPYWKAEPLLSMYPHWAGLKSLTLHCRDDVLYTEEPPSTDTIVLPLLENLSLTFPAQETKYYQPWLLEVLDFSNVLNFHIRLSVKTSEFVGGKIRYAQDNVRALLQHQRNYSKLEQIKFSLSCSSSVFFTATFERDLNALDAKILFAAFDIKAGSVHPDPLGIESIACTKELSVFLRRQSGWEGLSEMTITRGNEEKAERVRTAFPGWAIHHQSSQEELNLEAKYKYMDERPPLWQSSADGEGLALIDEKEGLFMV